MKLILTILLVPLWSAAFARAQAMREASLLWTLAVGLEKQFPLVSFLEALADESRGAWRVRLRALAELLETDMPVPDALEAIPGILPIDILALIRVGSRTGNLTGALRDAARLSRQRGETPAINIGGAFAYLLAIGFAMLTITGFIMYYIIPKFKAIFEGFDTELPEITRTVISVADFWADFWYLIVPGMGLTLMLLWMLIGWGLDLTGLGPGIGRKQSVLFQWLFPRLRTPSLMRSLAVCVEGGRPLLQGLSSLAEEHRDPNYRSRMAHICYEVESGTTCWLVLRTFGMLRRTEVALLETAERVGNLPWALRSIADRTEHRWVYRLQLAIEFLDPVLILAAGSVVGAICVSMFYPLVSLISRLS